MSYLNSFQRPFQSIKKLLIGGILNGIPLLNIITSVIVTGYIAECARLTLVNKNTLPEWGSWLTLFKRGLFIMIIWAIYGIPFFSVLLISFFNNLPSISSLEPVAFFRQVLQTHSGVIILIILLFVITWYVALQGVIQYIKNYKFKDAFQPYHILSAILTTKYFKAWLAGFAYTFLVGLLLESLIYALHSDSTVVGVIYNLFSGCLTFITAVTTLTLVAEASRSIKVR